MGCIYRIQTETLSAALWEMEGWVYKLTDLAKLRSSVKLCEQKIWPHKNPWSCGPGVTAVLPTPRSCSTTRQHCLFLMSLALRLPLCLPSTAPEFEYIPATSFAFTSAVNRRLQCAEIHGTELLPAGKMYLIYSLPSLKNFIWKICSGLVFLKMFAEQSTLALKFLLFPFQGICIY